MTDMEASSMTIREPIQTSNPPVHTSTSEPVIAVQPGDRVIFGPSHEHVWVIGRVETELVHGTVIAMEEQRVAYLVCQCGAVKRVVPE